MKIKGIIALIAIAFFVSFPVDTYARGPKVGGNNWSNNNTNNNNNGHHNGHHGGKKTIGAPLDGGLLTILGAAGVAYFVSRKKKKNGELL